MHGNADEGTGISYKTCKHYWDGLIYDYAHYINSYEQNQC